MGIIIAIHIIACILLIAVILIQAGRGGGLVDSFSGIESMLGTKTNTFLTRTTTVLAVIFISTCLTLAFLSAKQSRSLMKNIKIEPQTTEVNVPQAETPTPTDQPEPKTE